MAAMLPPSRKGKILGRISAVIGAANGALAIIAAAFGGHGLEGRLAAGLITESQLNAFETGAEHHLYHAIALILVGLACHRTPARNARPLSLAAGLFLAGILLFSGSLYLYGALGVRAVVWITPIGGLANILGWLAFAWGLFRILGRSDQA
jgi:uncharacterized membrane protein YgdD (TMEM256/DUF423 family)